MRCTKCNKENDEGNQFCNYCGDVLTKSTSSKSSLTGSDRLKIGWLFVILILPLGGFGMAIIPILILVSAIYIMKKDKSFKAISNAKKYIKIYITLLALGWILSLSIVYYEFNHRVDNEKHSYKLIPNPAYATMINPAFKFIKNPKYDIRNKELKQFFNDSRINCKSHPNYCPKEYIGNGEPEYVSNGEPEFLPEEPRYIENKKIVIEMFYVVIVCTICFSIIGTLLMFIFNTLFFSVLERNKEWVINNGIFADADKTYSDIICTNCGGKLNSKGSFCPSCGHKG